MSLIVKKHKVPELVCGTPLRRFARHVRRLQGKLAAIERRTDRRAKGYMRLASGYLTE